MVVPLPRHHGHSCLGLQKWSPYTSHCCSGDVGKSRPDPDSFGQGGTSLLQLQISLISDNQGNIFSTLNQKTKKMPTAAFLMQLVLLLYQRSGQLCPCHRKRDLNQWADELTHPNFSGFDKTKELSVPPIFKSFTLLPHLLPNWNQTHVFSEPT